MVTFLMPISSRQQLFGGPEEFATNASFESYPDTKAAFLKVLAVCNRK